MFNYLRATAARQLRSLDDHIRLIVVHPNYAQQHTLLAEFFNQDSIYVRLMGKKLSQAELKAQFEAALEAQSGSKRLNKSAILILDECDRADSKALDAFLPELLSTLPDHSKVIVFSREIPHCVLNNAVLRKQTSFIPSDKLSMLWDYPRLNTDTTLLEVRSFGDGRVVLNGQSIENWDGVLPRSLFFFLVDRGMTTRNEIFETFWPNLPTREATNVFHVTKRKISEVLGIDLTTYWSGFYRISPNIELSYDVILFTEMIQNSAVAPVDEAIELLHRATALYQGNFLSSMDLEWSKKRRQELSQDYAEALASLAKSQELKDHKHEALGLYLRAAATNRYREDLASSIMQLYRELGQHKDALTIYARLNKELRADLGVEPAPHLQELADEIQQEMNNHHS